MQSENPYIAGISWLLECNTYYGEASRMIQFKEKSKENANFSVGLLTYPILMAADILYLDSKYVPVGIDQKQHVELARDIAERFNKKYGKTFEIPRLMIKEEGLKIKDLRNPEKKMSKSEENPNGSITLFDTEEEIRKKIMSATTDSEMRVYFDEENKKGISNLINIAIAFSDEKETVKTIEEKFEGKSYKEFKEYVADILVKKIGKIQEKYNEVITSGILDEILDEGKTKVQKLAQDKYIEMTKKMGLTRS